MLVILDRHSGVPAFRQVVDQIKEQILTGQVAAGTQLTSVRQLSAELKVNPMTVSKAYSVLELEGFVERQAGIGLFVRTFTEKAGEREQKNLLEATLRKAAAQAVQMQVSPEDASKLLVDLIKGFLQRGGC